MKEKKYSSLARYLAELSEGSVTLTFADIEQIINSKLPAAAYKHHTWWSNEKSGTHNWAHLWQAAGWMRESASLKDMVVTFNRVEIDLATVLESLRPTTKETIFDLLGVAHISTEKWHVKGNGESVKNAKANPSFCYNWSFGSLFEGYALCIWHEFLRIEDGAIVTSENMRSLEERLRQQSKDSEISSTQQRRATSQTQRAQDFDDALSISYSRGLPVRVIVASGDRHDRDQEEEGSSYVQYRKLDPAKWYVHRYDESTGDFLLVRGVQRHGVADSDEIPLDEEDTKTPDKVQLRAIKIRQGQGEFRARLLSAYRETCVVTGCKILDILEAAHIRPHSVELNYHVTNGLLLRSDIHTLFDLGKLCIDSNLKIRLSSDLLRSEYDKFEGREMLHPNSEAAMPNREALLERLKAFEK